jgi:hypothetical protein
VDIVDSMKFRCCPTLQFFDMHSYMYTNINYRSSQTRMINSLYRVFFVTCKKVLCSEHRIFQLRTSLDIHMLIFTAANTYFWHCTFETDVPILYISLYGDLPEDGHVSLIHLGGEFDLQKAVHRDIFLIIEANKMHYFSTLFW